MAQQINATMSTKIALDLLSASESVKSLTAVVRSSQNAWKAQEAEMKSAGDAVGAAQAKYDGLGKSIEAQQSKIDALKAKQSELKGNTADVAQQFLKYQQQIDGATKQLASMQAQQDRAKQAMDYQKSGLAGLQQEYTAAARANQAYVTRLEAEGNQQEANKAKMEGYKSSIVNLNEQLAKQSAELDKIAAASGKDSDAWRTQKTRVDETATSLAKAKSSMTGLQAEMDKANPSIFDRIKSHIAGTKSEADKTKLSFKKMVSATAIGQTISNGWSEFSGTIKSTITQGIQLAEAGEQATRVWKTLGVSGKGAEQLVGQMCDLKSETNLSADQVSVLQKRFYGMTGNVDKTKALTLGVATLADKLRLSGDGASTFAKSLQRAFNNGKLTTGVLTRMENAAPGLGSALAKAGGVSETAFNSMVASGQISSKKLQDLIVKISKDSKSTFNDFGNTAEGATQRLKGAWQGVEATLAKPLVSVQSTGINSIVNVLKSSAVTSLFTSLGKAMAGVAQQASNLLNYVAQHQKDIGGIITSLGTIVKIFAGTVWHTIAGIVSSIAKSFGLMGSGASKANDPLKNANTALSNIAKNKSGIQTTAKIVLGLWAAVKGGEIVSKIAKGAITAISGAMDLFSKRAKIMAAAQKVLNVVMEANPWIKLAVVILAVGTALFELYKHNAKFKAFVDGIVKSIQNMWKGMEKWISQMVKGWNSAWSSVGKGWNSFLKTMNGWGKSIASAWNKIWAPIAKGMSAVWAGVVKATKVGLNVLKLAIVIPIALIVGLAIKAWQEIEKPFMAVWNGIAKFIKPILTSISNFITGTAKDVSSAWNKYWQFVAKFFTGIWDTIVKVGTTAFNTVSKGISSFLSAVNKVWTDSWNAISKFFSNIWNGMVKFLTPIINGISSAISNVINAIKNTWNTVWGAISKFFGDTWNGMVKFYSPIIHDISSTIGSVINTIKKVWKDVWGDVGSFFGGIWDGIKKAAESGINFVVRVIRTGLSAVNGVLGFFGVKKVSLPSYVHFAQGGKVGNNGTQLAMVNDDGSEHYKELIHKKRTGQWLYTDKKNAILPLETGDRIYNGKESKAIADMYGIPGFAHGGIIGSVWDGVKDASSWVVDKAEDVGKWIGDKFEAIVDWIAHPVKHVTDLISRSIKGIISSSPVKAFGDLGVGIFKHAYSGIGAWIKKELKKIEDSMGNPGGSGVQRWKPYVIKALKANGFDASDYQVAAWMRVIQRESNGNPKAINLWDSNAKAGIPSMGLVQTIGPTFNAYKFPGHNDVYNGYDDLLAGIHYMKAIYGSGSSAFARVSGPEGYANGGLITQPIHALVGEDGPETILPLTKTSRAWQLLGQAVTNINHNLGNGAVAESENSGTDDLGKKLDNIADLLTKLSFVLQVGDDQFYPKVAPKVKQYNDRTDRFNAYWKGGTV
ncbi:phage minor tail protein [Lacticaseibacillus casei DSM 20011 = JCM 1134 = ATCC 393]|uniref:Phage minor tail protein n=14 Tax=Lacticaseibacillus TaxID=2759736 RepID=A0AAD1AN95_LACCA|nr:phage minor tail protein [Lacticaseibacillus casei DSM 20011 = JCM 1134 = ATCC 393]